MSGFDINRAARMMRAGNEFSETNRKLRDAVYSFIEWLYETVTEYQLPPAEDIGWVIKKVNDRQISLSFQKDRSGWYTVTTNTDTPQMYNIVLCCRALAGPEGARLIIWLERETQERNQLLVALQSAIQSFRSSMIAAKAAI